MPLGMEVHLGPRDLLLDGDPAPHPPQKRGHRPQFSVHVYRGQTAGRLKVSKNVSVSALQGLGLGLVAKIRCLGLVELQEGLGVGLVSDRKANVSVS